MRAINISIILFLITCINLSSFSQIPPNTQNNDRGKKVIVTQNNDRGKKVIVAQNEFHKKELIKKVAILKAIEIRLQVEEKKNKEIKKINTVLRKENEAFKTKSYSVAKKIGSLMLEGQVKDDINKALETMIDTLNSRIAALEDRSKILVQRVDFLTTFRQADSLYILNLKADSSRLTKILSLLESQNSVSNTIIDELSFKVVGFQDDTFWNKKIVNHGLDLDEKNSNEVRHQHLRRVSIETLSSFNISKKAFKCDIIYRGLSKSLTILKDQSLWIGANSLDIITSHRFSDYRDGYFELIIYYEENEKHKIYLTKKFRWF